MGYLIANVDLSLCLLVALDPQDSAALQAALRRAGLRTEATAELVTPGQVPARATAIVWFADEYPAIAVVASIGRLRAQRPGLRIIVVTAWPSEFATLLVQATGRVAPVILRKPAVVADILEALRSSLPTGAPS